MQTSFQTSAEARPSWLDRPLQSVITLNWETVLFASLIILAVFTRFYKLEPRTMSHDETSHVYFSWLLSQGRGYMHDPVTHGPFQFHIVALTYFLLGDNDFSARVPVVLFGIASVAFLWFYRRYLGRAGTLIAALLFIISPYMLYYARYVRNESFVAFFGLLGLWAILRYLDTGAPRYLYTLSAAVVMHFITKETAYIYTAQMLLFLALYFIYQITQRPWILPQARTNFLLFLTAFVFLLSGAGAVKLLAKQETAAANSELPAVPTPNAGLIGGSGLDKVFLVLGILALLALAGAAYFLIKGYTLERVRRERSFNLLILVGALVLPLLSAFVLNAIGWTVPVNAGAVNSMTLTDVLRMGGVVLLIFIAANAVGLWWNWRLWLGNFALFYAIFTVFYTTIFTNGAGLATGLVGGLGYWLAQQPVERGSQPWYYFLFVQVPIYEYLPAIGTFLAIGLALFKRSALRKPADLAEMRASREPESQFADGPVMVYEAPEEIEDLLEDPIAETDSLDADPEDVDTLEQPAAAASGQETYPEKPAFLSLFIFWAVTSMLAFTIAGEKMPWLTVHITLPMILLAGWSTGQVVENTNWKDLLSVRGLLILVLMPVFLICSATAAGSLLGAKPPFQGQDLTSLQATSAFVTALLSAVASGWGLVVLLKRQSLSMTSSLFGLAILALLALLTARTAFTASYINYDLAREYLVYAHSGPGAKEAMEQIEEISRRTTNGLGVQVAYDNETSYPFWWYLRNYTNQRYYGENPTRDLRQVPLILVGDANYSKIEPIVGENYQSFEYIRMWWPDQGYFGLTWERVVYALTNREWRAALFQIWLNRDYTKYSQLIGKDLSLPNWDPANRFRLYIRNDVIAQMWNYGTSPSAAVSMEDPYEKGKIDLSADIVLGAPGNQAGQFLEPRGIAAAPDGSLYIADTGNNRVQHLAPDGTVLKVWGTFGDISKGEAAGGTFNSPWDVALGPDGSVYVADTWNHRIQKFNADGEFLKMWGYGISQTEDPLGFYGPRGIAVDSQGYVYVTDTGNKRVVVFDAEGQVVTQFGSSGFEPGQFNEPVGIDVDANGNVYVADVWNQRIQSFSRSGDWFFNPEQSWDINGWYGQSLNNYPFLTVGDRGNIFATDPEGYRVLEFTSSGEFVHYWGDFGVSNDRFNLPSGIAADPNGGVWVLDAGSGRVMHFSVPEK